MRATPEVVVIEVAVAVSITVGLIVTVKVLVTVAPAISVAVTVSVITRDVVEFIEVRDVPRFTNAEFAVDVSIVTPKLRPDNVRVLVPVPLPAVKSVVVAAFPAVIVMDVGPVNVGAGLTIMVTKSLAVPP